MSEIFDEIEASETESVSEQSEQTENGARTADRNGANNNNYNIDKRLIREGAFILSFEMLFRDESADELYELLTLYPEDSEYVQVSEESLKLVKAVMEKSAELDVIIREYSQKRSVDRIPKINLAMLRIALYEALFENDVPANVAISEAVLITQKFGQEPDVAFVNGVLGSFSRAASLSDGDESLSDGGDAQ